MKTLTAMALLAIALAAPAYAAPPDCQSLPAALAYHAKDFNERAVFFGNTYAPGHEDESVILLTSDDGSWSLLRTNGDIACIIDFGYEAEMAQ